MRFDQGNNLPRAKVSNQSNILRMIYYDGPLCRRDIAARLDLTLPTITQAVNNMIIDGLVQNDESLQKGNTGRRARPLAIRPEARYFAGIETTGIRRTVCICDYSGQVVASVSEHSGASNYWSNLEQTCAALRRCLEQCALPLERLSGIGFAVPGLVDRNNGILKAHPRTHWKDKAVQKDFAALTGFSGPITLENNACARAAGAQLFHRDVLADSSNFAYLFVDVGIACPLFLSTSGFMGSVVGAGEVGHMVMQPNGRQCSCGNFGCLEAYSSDTAILQQCREAMSQGGAARLRALCQNPEALTMAQVLEAQKQEDADVCQILDSAICVLGVAIANIINFACPEVMLIECKLFSDLKNRQRLMEVAYSNLYNVSFIGTQFAFIDPEELSGARSAAVMAIDVDICRYAQSESSR